MELLHFFAPGGRFIAPYLSDIAVAFVACFLVMLGGDINAFVRRTMRNQHFIVRTLVFVLINAFGYGLIIVKASPYLARTLAQLDRGMMFVIVVISFIIIGLWAQKNRQI
ncbi:MULTISPECIES: DUF3392 domain-containing protein [Vibrio]|uniref:DUF3392 family protein n=2 Tax=Vibrio TaxID=662 RepID=A0A7X4RUW2_9VIBR|nr:MULTISPECIES: DUF3392 domain-containing protein [Vibrio]MBF9000094.1 DUF3392 domain-containing protein [Vibrio nitrifigilis]MZI93685.1 DUF3392 family protein [Vibrio eleionomae]